MSKIPRNHLVLVVRQRNGGPMKDRRSPRGGVRNEVRDLLDEASEEEEMMPEKAQPDICEERVGLTDPSHIVVHCRCPQCVGNLEFDGVNRDGYTAFLMCNVCGCTSVISVKRLVL